MRVLAALVLVTAAVLAPGLGAADPAQPETTTAAAPAAAAPSPTTAPSATAATAAQSTAPVSAAAPARRPTDDTVVVVGKPQNDNDPDRIVCRKGPPEVGSRIGGGTKCLTARTWKSMRRSSQDALQDVQLRGLSAGR